MIATTDAGPPPSLEPRLLTLHHQRRRLREMEREARHLADALEEAAKRLRRCHPVHPAIEPVIPKAGITKFASDLRDLAIAVQAAEEVVDAELERRSGRA
jgi:hypothetical protein